MSLEGKNVIITGATSGIGVTIASVLSQNGAKVFVGGRRVNRGEQVAGDTKSTFHVVDVSNEESTRVFFAAAESHFGGPATVDFLLLNAGVEGVSEETHIGETFKSAAFDEIFNINVRGFVLGLQYGTPLMRKGGYVLATSSVVSLMAIGGHPIYTASKAALDSLVRSYAAQFADSKDDRIQSLTVMSINLTLYESDMSLRFNNGSEEGRKAAASFFNPCGRPGKPEELAATVLELFEGKLSGQYKSGDHMAVDADIHFHQAEYMDRMSKKEQP